MPRPNENMVIKMEPLVRKLLIAIVSRRADLPESAGYLVEKRWDRDMIKRRFRSLMGDWFRTKVNLKPFLRGYQPEENTILPAGWSKKATRKEIVNYETLQAFFNECVEAGCKCIDQLTETVLRDEDVDMF